MNCPGPSEDSSLVFRHCSQVHSNSLKRYSKAVGMMGHQIIIDPHFHESESEVAQSCPTLWDPVDCSLPGSSIHGILKARITGVGCHALFQGIFLTQESNLLLLCLLHWQASSLQLVKRGRSAELSSFLRNLYTVLIPWRRKWQPTPLFLPGKSH